MAALNFKLSLINVNLSWALPRYSPDAAVAFSSVEIADLKKDGNFDIVGINNYKNSVWVLTPNGIGGYAAPVEYSLKSNSFVNDVTLGDVNGDGKLDIVTVEKNTNTVSILTQNTSGGFNLPNALSVGASLINPNPKSVVLGDINGDGTLDIVTADYNSNTVSILPNNGTSFSNPIILSVGTEAVNPQSIALGDLNGDGKLDIVTADFNSNSVSILINDGINGFKSAEVLSVGDDANNPNSLALADLNGDGKLDIVTANLTSNNVSILFNNALGGFKEPILLKTASDHPSEVKLADVNGDNSIDIITSNRNTTSSSKLNSNGISILTNNGVGGFNEANTVNTGGGITGAYALATTDIDGDGKVDIVTSNTTSSLSLSKLINANSSSYSFTNTSAAVKASLSVYGLQNTGGAGQLSLTGIQNLIGSKFNDNLKGNSDDNIINGGLGIDTLTGGGGNDTYVVNITAKGTLEDKILAGKGIDTVQVTGHYDGLSTTLIANTNIDNVDISATGFSHLNLTGNSLANKLTGNDFNNTLNDGGPSSIGDTLIGGLGDDCYIVNSSNDLIIELNGQGIDTVKSSISLTLAVNVENLTLTGSKNINGTGNDQSNIITGNSGNNILTGGYGDTTLMGGAGKDTLIGGHGANTFWFDSVPNAKTNVDLIKNFITGYDKLEFSVSVLKTIGDAGQFSDYDSRFWSSSTGLAHDASDRIIYNTTTGGISYDSDGSGKGAAVLLEVLGVDIHPTSIAATDIWIA